MRKLSLHIMLAITAIAPHAAWADEDPFSQKPLVVSSGVNKAATAAKPSVPNQEDRNADADLARKMLMNAGVLKGEAAANLEFQPGAYGEQLGSVATPEMMRQLDGSTGVAKAPRPVTGTASKSGLPGMQRNSSDALVIKSMPGVNDLVNVSNSLPNRISTPFKSPQVIDLSKSPTQVTGGNVYIMPKGDKPIGLFIQDDVPNSPVISLTLVPKDNIPGQNIMVTLDGYDNLAGKDSEKKEIREAGEYTDYIRFIMRNVAKNVAPDGFVTEKMKEPKAVSGNLEATSDTHYAGSLLDIYKYKIKNIGQQPITLAEQSFYTKGVRAVSIFPKLLLQYGQDTNVIILRSKPGVMEEAAK